MSRMIHSKYGYEPPEWVQADSRLDKWCENKKRLAKWQGAIKVNKNVIKNHDSRYSVFDHW